MLNMEGKQIHDFFVKVCCVTPKNVKNIKFLYKKGSTVRHLKDRIHALTGVDSADQRIIVRGYPMADSTIPIIEADEIIYSISTHAEPAVEKISIVYGKGLDGRNIGVPIDYDTSTDDDLKEYIGGVHDKPKDSVRIVLAGKLLNDVSLKEVEIWKHACFHYIFEVE